MRQHNTHNHLTHSVKMNTSAALRIQTLALYSRTSLGNQPQDAGSYFAQSYVLAVSQGVFKVFNRKKQPTEQEPKLNRQLNKVWLENRNLGDSKHSTAILTTTVSRIKQGQGK